MTRSPELSNQAYSDLLLRLQSIGFDLSSFKRLPQNWATDQERLEEILQLGDSAPLEAR